MKIGILICTVACLGTYPGTAQKLKKADKALAARLAEDAAALEADSGRVDPGGAPASCAYLSTQFQEMGLGKKGNDYLQVEHVDEGLEIGPGCALSLNGKTAVPGTDFFPLAGSPDGHASGSSGISLNESGLPWIHDLKYDLEEGKGTPGFDIKQVLVSKAADARKKGATALLVYNSSGDSDNIIFDPRDKKTTFALPVLYINKGLSSKVFKDSTAYVDVDLTVRTREKMKSLYSVEGYVDNGAGSTVVMECCLDSAGGVPALMELARLVKGSGWKKHNYLVLGFTGSDSLPGKVDYVLNVSGIENPDPRNPVLRVRESGLRGQWKENVEKLKDAFLHVVYEGSATGQARADAQTTSVFFDTGRPGSKGYEGEALAVRYVYKAMEATERK